MHRATSIPAALRELYGHLPARRRCALLPLLALMLVGAVAELFTIGALVPFLTLVASPGDAVLLQQVRPWLNAVGAQSHHQELYALMAVFALAALSAGLLRLALLWASQNFVYGVAYDISVKLYADTLHRPYLYHTQRNSSEIIASIAKTEFLTTSVLMPLMNTIVAMVISGFIIVGLLAVDWKVAVLAGGGFAGIYVLVSLLTRARLQRNSKAIADSQSTRIRAMQEGLGGIRDILIDGSQATFIDFYENIEKSYRHARSNTAFFANAPRFFVEGFGTIAIAIIAVMMTDKPGGFDTAIPVLGALALGAQKLLPLLQQIYLGWVQATGNKQSLFDILELIQATDRIHQNNLPALPFLRAISLVGVSYSYGRDVAPALSDINLTIPKGARVGIVGKTGSGKSTLMDLIVGLLQSSEGVIMVDGIALTAETRRRWQKNIAHVPQTIFLADASLTENIAFGVKAGDIDHARVLRVVEQSELTDVVARLPHGLDTRIGERGIQLSGGQRQRIGIARALYKQADVLVLDEATSALDGDTEDAIMSSIERLDRSRTILIIAHRVSTLHTCDMIVKLEKGHYVGKE